MQKEQLEFVDFSKGIRSEEIQHNFNVLDEALKRERLSIAGFGIANGLDSSINDFTYNLSKGSIIDYNGKEIFFKEQSINIEYPKLIRIVNEDAEIINGVIKLKHIPYATKTTAEYASPNEYQITILSKSDDAKVIPIQSIKDNEVLVSNMYVNSQVSVSYNTTEHRKDLVYIDKNSEIKISVGSTSSSTSIERPEDVAYDLSIIYIDPFYKENGQTVAKAFIFADIKKLRTIYTDSNNNLYLNGTSFDSLKIIHMTEPVEPSENSLWYDFYSNKLKVWKTINGISDWFNVNDTSIIPVLENKIWLPEENPKDLQTFLFDEREINLHFHPGKNEIQVIIDNSVLMSDQFEEIISLDKNEEYENIGIGFKLNKPLDKGAYVEVRITHRVNENPRKKFQRSATFICEEELTFSNQLNPTQQFETKYSYRYKESQLEVFLDGSKLVPNKDFIEGSDLKDEDKITGKKSYQFTILKPLINQSSIVYKINYNTFSYDHLSDLFDNVHNLKQYIESQNSEIENFKNLVNEEIDNMKTSVSNLGQLAEKVEMSVKKGDIIPAADIDESISKNIYKGLINQTIHVINSQIYVDNINKKDFITLCNLNNMKILRRDIDVLIHEDVFNNKILFNFGPAINSNLLTVGDYVYITGINF